jgi:hypothetical protein
MSDKKAAVCNGRLLLWLCPSPYVVVHFSRSSKIGNEPKYMVAESDSARLQIFICTIFKPSKLQYYTRSRRIQLQSFSIML